MSAPTTPPSLVYPTTLQPDGQLHPLVRKSLERMAGDPSKADELTKLVTKSCQNAAEEAAEEAARAAHFDELERIQSATLDADTDVWSTTDDGQIIPLTERIKQLGC